jgi:hypothetical protein
MHGSCLEAGPGVGALAAAAEVYEGDARYGLRWRLGQRSVAGGSKNYGIEKKRKEKKTRINSKETCH